MSLAQSAATDPASGFFFGTQPVDVTAPDDTLVDSGDPSKYFTRAYYANLIDQFQQVLQNLDTDAASFAQIIAAGTASDTDNAAMQSWLDDYANKKTELKAAAATVNGIVSAVNAVGGTFPAVNLPTTLQQIPPLVIVGVAAAAVAVTSLITWGIAHHDDALNIANAMQGMTPQQKSQLLEQMQQGGALNQFATVIKWVAIGVAVFFAFKAFQEYRSAEGGALESG